MADNQKASAADNGPLRAPTRASGDPANRTAHATKNGKYYRKSGRSGALSAHRRVTRGSGR